MNISSPTPSRDSVMPAFDDALALGVMQHLAHMWQEEGDLNKSADACRHIARRCEAAFGPHSPKLAHALLNLSYVVYRQKNLDEAEGLLRQAQAIWAAQHPLPPELGTCLNNLGRIEEERGRITAGIALHRQAVAFRRQRLGECHPDTAFSLGNLGVALASDGQWREAADTLEAAVACYARLGKYDCPDAVGYKENLALCRRALAGGDTPAALPPREALLAEIIERELRMFVATPSEGGTATCQQRPEGFRLMRRMTHEPLGDATLASYLEDLRRAEAQGRNFMIEKYARMDDRLPPLQDSPRIAEIVALEAEFTRAASSLHPRLIHTPAGDNGNFVRYLRCELETLSPATLELYAADMRRAAALGENPVLVRYECLARLLGRDSLAQLSA